MILTDIDVVEHATISSWSQSSLVALAHYPNDYVLRSLIATFHHSTDSTEMAEWM